MYDWIRALHVIFMVTWFAGLFYLPRLYVYHAAGVDPPSHARFVVMERKLYYGIMAPAALLTVGFGLWLIGLRGLAWLGLATWLQLKLLIGLALVVYHLYLGALRKAFAAGRNVHGHVFYRWLNEVPVLALVAMVVLAEVKPWSG